MTTNKPTTIINSVRLPKPNEIIAAISAFGGLLILSYTFVHTSNVLARYIHPPFVGWLAGGGIELIIFSMSWKLATIKGKEPNRLLKFTLIVSLIVSTIANVAEGYFVSHKQELTWANIGMIDPVQALVGISSNLLLPVLVFAVSELVGSDIERITKQVAPKPSKEKQEAPEQAQTPELEAEQLDPNDYKQAVYAILKEGKQMGPRPMAAAVGCSPATAKKWIDSFQTERVNGSIMDPADVPFMAGAKNGHRKG